ncbi:crossover junction endonuclease MUS81-like isoform X1 [Silene latifolia]|uniref:crossover junction endonuclease MUS81-like isoform X1 n=2 Tax=Silene latifolia TaxID=37657 RepID=UPI003D770613
MGKLVDKGLVDKLSCPAKYKLSDEGRRVAVECLSRSGMIDSGQSSVSKNGCSDSEKELTENLTLVSANSPQRLTSTTVDQNTKNAISAEYFEKFTRLGYSRKQVLHAWTEVSVSSPNQDMSTLWLTVLCRLREDEVYGVQPVPRAMVGSSSGDASLSNRFTEGQQNVTHELDKIGDCCTNSFTNSEGSAVSLRSENQMRNTFQSGFGASQNILKMPPLKTLEKI